MNQSKRKQLSVFEHVKFRRFEDYIYSCWCAGKGISFTQLLILDLVMIYTDGIEPSELADMAVIPRQTVTSILNELEKKNYIKRFPHVTDGRKKLVRITKEGESYASAVIDEMVENDNNSFNILSNDEQKNFNLIYKKLVDEMSIVYQVDIPKWE